MINFYPGPSMVHPEIAAWVKEAYLKGILSYNHRSSTITNLYKGTVEQLKAHWQVPNDYEVYFVSSATEAWEICYQSLSKKNTLHFYNGSFGKKWHQYAQYHRTAIAHTFTVDTDPSTLWHKSIAPSSRFDELICLTHTETSNGTALPHPFIDQCRTYFPNALIAVDATASFGGLSLPFTSADIWFSSVQKCLGLPAGMGIILASPRAVSYAKKHQKNNCYNSIANLSLHYQNRQTTHTPNVLNIYLLSKVLKKWKTLTTCHEMTIQKQEQWHTLFAAFASKKKMKPLITNRAFMAPTIFTIQYDKNKLINFLNNAEQEGFIIGKGYGIWQDNTFRIANFPVIPWSDYLLLADFIQNYSD